MNYWYYEFDGDRNARTHYAIFNDPDSGNTLRKDFRTAKDARDFVAKINAAQMIIVADLKAKAMEAKHG